MALTDGPLDLLQGGAGSGIAQAGIGAATGNPIALAAGLAGIGLSIFGGTSQAGIQKEEAGVSAEIAGYEEQINKQRQNLATLTYRRQGIENMRKVQQSRSLARAAGVQGGAQFGSGVAGAEAQASAEGAFNTQDLAESYKIGQNIFGLTSSIDKDQIRLAQLGGQASTYGGVSAIGQGLTSGAMALGRLSGGFGAQG